MLNYDFPCKWTKEGLGWELRIQEFGRVTWRMLSGEVKLLPQGEKGTSLVTAWKGCSRCGVGEVSHHKVEVWDECQRKSLWMMQSVKDLGVAT